MMRQASIRNQRNKGLRLNNFLQICILTLVFFWLLYQLKRSFDKKKGLDEHRSGNLNNVIDSHSEFAVLGRKALPHDQSIVSEGKVSDEDKENGEEVSEEGENGDEEVKEIPEDGIDELDNEQEDEQDEDGDDAVNEEEKDEQVEEAEFLDDQDPEEEDSSLEAHDKSYNNDDESNSLHQDRSNRTGDRNNSRRRNYARNVGNNSTITDLVALQNDINYNNSLTTSGSAVEKLKQEVSPINHSKLKGNLLTAGMLDARVDRQTNETLGKNNLLPLDNEALIKSISNAQNTAISLQ